MPESMTAEARIAEPGQKRARVEPAPAMEVEDFGAESDGEEGSGPSMIVQFMAMDGEAKGPQIDMPVSADPIQMEQVLNELLAQKEKLPYSFYIGDEELAGALGDHVRDRGLSTEAVLRVAYQPLAVFRVRPVTRCTDTMPGHTDAVLHVSYSPDGRRLASGGGDATVRFWDVGTSLPRHTCRGHKHHVLCTAWSPDGRRFASADKRGEIRLWDPDTGGATGQPLAGHKQWITSLAWEPMHRNPACERLASASKDGSVKIWNVRTGRAEVTLSGHADSVECIRWGGEGLLYSGSRDRTIKVWAVEERDGRRVGILVRTLVGHGHRVNALALSTDAVLRTGPFDHHGNVAKPPAKGDAAEAATATAATTAAAGAAAAAGAGAAAASGASLKGAEAAAAPATASTAALAAAALARYQAARGGEGMPEPERLVSASDDFTLFLWRPAEEKQPVARLTGHQQPVNHLAISPDGRHIASAGFDKKIKLWDGRTGRFIATLTGHVGAVYQVAWSSDSRLLVSASKDSTVKLWSVAEPKRAKATLPGHADEVYALDWAPNGTAVASGSKDRTIKIWKN